MKNFLKSKRKIKVIIFDIGGILVFFDNMIVAKKIFKMLNKDPKKILNTLNGNRSNFTNSYEFGNSKWVYLGIFDKELNVKKSLLKSLIKCGVQFFVKHKTY